MPPLMDPDSATATAPSMRASDADRLATVGHLQDAVTRGLLTPDEGGERMADAFAAVHLTDLDPLTEDLPPAPAERAAPPGWRALGTLTVEQVRASLTSAVTGRLSAARVVTALLIASVVLLLLGALTGAALSDGGGGGGGGDGWHDHHEHWDDDWHDDWYDD